jgi:hypothetical protein
MAFLSFSNIKENINNAKTILNYNNDLQRHYSIDTLIKKKKYKKEFNPGCLHNTPMHH